MYRPHRTEQMKGLCLHSIRQKARRERRRKEGMERERWEAVTLLGKVLVIMGLERYNSHYTTHRLITSIMAELGI